MMETRLIPKKFLKLIKNLADENRNYKKIFGNVFWLEVVKEKNYSWFNLRLNSIMSKECLLTDCYLLELSQIVILYILFWSARRSFSWYFILW